MKGRRADISRKSILASFVDSPTGKQLGSSVLSHPYTSTKPLLERTSFQPQHLKRIILVCIHGPIAYFIPWHHSGPFHHLLGILLKCWPNKGNCHLSEFFCRNWFVSCRLACDFRKSLCHVVNCDGRAHRWICLSVGLLDTRSDIPSQKINNCELIYNFFLQI